MTLKTILPFLALLVVLVRAKPPQTKRENPFGDFIIDSHTSDQDVLIGHPITLMCRVKTTGTTDLFGNENWKTCMWTRDSDNAKCLFEYVCIRNCGLFGTPVFEVQSSCESSLNGLEYFGSDPAVENHICGVTVLSAGHEDSSTWTCKLEECKSMGGCKSTLGNGNYAEATMKVTVHDQ